MAVYVDNFNAPYRGMIMCHMIADSTDELVRMALKIKVQTKWIQDRGTNREHFDICLSKKALAIQNGAIEIGFRELAAKTAARKEGKKFVP